MSAATEGFSAMISDLDMGARREERQIVPKVAAAEQENVCRGGPTRARAARARAHARDGDRGARCGAPRGSADALPEPARKRRDAAVELERASAPPRRLGDGSPRARGERVDVGRIVARARASTARSSAVELVVGAAAAAAVAAPLPAAAGARRGCPARSRRASRLRGSADGSLSRTANGSIPAARRPRDPARRRGAR